MKIRYDPEADAMYITLKKAEVAETKKVDDNMIIDYAESGSIIGVELLFVKENNPELLSDLQSQGLSA